MFNLISIIFDSFTWFRYQLIKWEIEDEQTRNEMGSVWVIKTIKKRFPHFKYKNLFNYQTLKFFIGSHFPNFSSVDAFACLPAIQQQTHLLYKHKYLGMLINYLFRFNFTIINFYSTLCSSCCSFAHIY